MAPRFRTLPYRGEPTRVTTLPYRGQQPNYRDLANTFAVQAGIDPRIFSAQISQESGFDPSARSGAGAVGIAQIVPRYHPDVNPTDPVASLRWAANEMASSVRKYGSYQRALSAYNSGQPDKYKDPNFAGGQTYNYVRSIMSAAGKKGGAPTSALPLGGAPSFGAPSLGGDPIAAALISTLGQSPEAVNQALVGAALSASSAPMASSPSPLAPTAGGLRRSLQSGKVSLAPGADRAGVSINPSVVNFVGEVAGLAGQPLTIGTGTNHSRLTVNGTESDHWTGNAADVPAAGAQLIRLGQDALVAAGMPPEQARRQTGGGFNVGPYQIIFATDAPGWGNHYDHLHIGIRGTAR